jgi:hypothetical protein
MNSAMGADVAAARQSLSREGSSASEQANQTPKEIPSSGFEFGIAANQAHAAQNSMATTVSLNRSWLVTMSAILNLPGATRAV